MNKELLKYAAPILAEPISNLFNAIFTQHQTIKDLNKPKGEPVPSNTTRPITILEPLRSVYSTIALNRLQPKAKAFLHPSQAAHTPNRSTTDTILDTSMPKSTASKNKTTSYP
jgi:hypothetical protein